MGFLAGGAIGFVVGAVLMASGLLYFFGEWDDETETGTVSIGNKEVPARYRR